MSTPVAADGAVVTGTGTSVTFALPAKKAGDAAQYVILTPGRDATTNLSGGTTGRVLQDGGFSIWRSTVGTTGPAGATVTFKFPDGPFYAFAQVWTDGDANPNQPIGNEALRSALLGIATGAASGMPFNSGINPAGRGGRLSSPDGYEYLNDVVETARGVAFDVRAGFQYQTKSITDSGAWNDLRGMQVLDWFDPSKPAVLGMRPFPNGGTLAAAAAGTYDDHYVYIGQQIASKRPAGTGRVVLRLMWEFNLNSGYMNDKTGFIAAWRQIVTKIRQGAGDRVKFSWCPAASTNSLTTLQACYPGDDYVDVIAIDTYDAWVSMGQGFHDEATWLAQTGVGDVFAWAKGRGKLFAFDEWGGHNVNVTANHSGGDNPDFYRLVLEFCRKNADWIAYECVYSESEAGNVENNLFATNGTPVQLPQSRAAYIAKVQSLVS